MKDGIADEPRRQTHVAGGKDASLAQTVDQVAHPGRYNEADQPVCQHQYGKLSRGYLVELHQYPGTENLDLGEPIVQLIGNPLVAAMIWLGVTILGLGLGTFYHRLLAWQTMPGVELGSGWKSWWRMLILYALAYCGGMVVLMVSALLASFASLYIPLLGALILFAGISALFWTAVYFAFTAHGIVGYQFGVIKAIMESAFVVRANLLSTVGFLFSAFAITWFTTMEIWTLPGDASWYNLLAFVGFAFISTTLLAASYVFYQERRVWLVELRAKLVMRPSDSHEPPGTNA